MKEKLGTKIRKITSLVTISSMLFVTVPVTVNASTTNIGENANLTIGEKDVIVNGEIVDDTFTPDWIGQNTGYSLESGTYEIHIDGREFTDIGAIKCSGIDKLYIYYNGNCSIGKDSNGISIDADEVVIKYMPNCGTEGSDLIIDGSVKCKSFNSCRTGGKYYDDTIGIFQYSLYNEFINSIDYGQIFIGTPETPVDNAIIFKNNQDALVRSTNLSCYVKDNVFSVENGERLDSIELRQDSYEFYCCSDVVDNILLDIEKIYLSEGAQISSNKNPFANDSKLYSIKVNEVDFTKDYENSRVAELIDNISLDTNTYNYDFLSDNTYLFESLLDRCYSLFLNDGKINTSLGDSVSLEKAICYKDVDGIFYIQDNTELYFNVEHGDIYECIIDDYYDLVIDDNTPVFFTFFDMQPAGRDRVKFTFKIDKQEEYKEKIIIHVEKPEEWNNMMLWTFDMYLDGEEKDAIFYPEEVPSTWPGWEMEKEDNGYYTAKRYADTMSIIFANPEGNCQSVDINELKQGEYWFVNPVKGNDGKYSFTKLDYNPNPLEENDKNIDSEATNTEQTTDYDVVEIIETENVIVENKLTAQIKKEDISNVINNIDKNDKNDCLIEIQAKDEKENVSDVNVNIDNDALKMLDKNFDLKIVSDVAELLFPKEVLKNIIKQVGDKGITITIVDTKKSDLLVEQKAVLDNTDNIDIFDFNIKSGNKYISELGGKIKVTLPISNNLKDKKVSVIYIDDNGKVELVPTTVINGNAVINPSHFSIYAIVEDDVAKALVTKNDSNVSTNSAKTSDAAATNGMVFAMIIATIGIVLVNRRAKKLV